MTPAQKTPYMLQWWDESHDLLVALRLTRSDFPLMAKESPLPYREGLETFIQLCEQKHIPVLVFSAGIAGKRRIVKCDN